MIQTPNRRTALGLMLAVAGVGCSSVPGRMARMDLNEANGVAFIVVRVRGVDAWAQLDNRAGPSVLNAAFAKRVGAAAGVRDSKPSLMSVHLKRGREPFDIQPVLADMTLEEASFAAPLAGVVGKDLFDRWVVGLDIDLLMVDLFEPAEFPAPQGVAPIALRRSGPDQLVELVLPTGPVLAAIDLHSSSPLIVPPDIAAGLGQALPAGADVERLYPAGSVAAVKLAGAALADVPLTIRVGGPPEIRIGYPLLSRFNIQFDLPRDRLWMAPNKRMGKEWTARFVGLSCSTDEDGLTVLYVAPYSPAQSAGFKVGDRITRIDGQPATMDMIKGARSGQRLVMSLADGSERAVIGQRYY